MLEAPQRRRPSFTAGVHFVVLTAVCLSFSSAQAQDYEYPYHDPYVATATAAILNSDRFASRLKREAVHVPGLPGRNQLPVLKGRGELSVTLYRQDHPAPLIFILSGIGTNAYFGLGTYFAGLFHHEGSHVVLLPSPMSWNFALAASRSGAPGYAPEDARDLYDAMQRTLRVLRSRYHVKITRVNFMGASLGALEGAYLSVIDGEEQKIGIDTYLLVNPPLDLSGALKKLDDWRALREKFGREKSKGLQARALGIVESFSKEDRDDDPAVFDRLAKDFAGFATEDIQFLIAEDLQTVLPELIYVTQAIHDPSISKVSRHQVRIQLEKGKEWTFKDYAEKIAVPSWRLQAAEGQADSESFSQRGSLAAILDRLRDNPRVHIMHNADDPLDDPGSIETLKKQLGDQVKLYPHGGHLGNLWYSENKRDILGLFTTSDSIVSASASSGPREVH